MVLFAFASFSWAQDVEEEEDEEEEVVEVVKAKPVAKKAAGQSRMGLQVGMDGNSKMINYVYDMGTGLRILVGLDFMQYTIVEESFNAATQQTVYEEATKNALGFGVGAEYQLGKVLLPYGVGARLDIYNEAMVDEAVEASEMQGKGMRFAPYFYTEAELVKNLNLGLQAGAYYTKPDGGDAAIGLKAAGNVTFYFM